jgi:hypothetical protein
VQVIWSSLNSRREANNTGIEKEKARYLGDFLQPNMPHVEYVSFGHVGETFLIDVARRSFNR